MQGNSPLTHSLVFDIEAGYPHDDDSDTLTLQSKVESQTKQASFWNRLTGKSHATVGWKQSIKAIATYSWLNVLFIFVPCAWVAHFMHPSHNLIFALCVLAMIPLTKMLHYIGDQLALNCSKATGDLITVTVHNFVETILSIILLSKCELKLLQSTIAGIILLRILLVSGTAFITGGLRRKSQMLHPQQNQLNQTLLMTGTFALLLPVLFYKAIDHNSNTFPGSSVINEPLRQQILIISRALSPLLLLIYICSCYYIHYPLDENTEKDAGYFNDHDPENPEINFWMCLVVVLIVGGLMSVTTEFLVSSIQPLKHQSGIREEFFGLVLIPLVSYSADGLLVSVFYIRSQLRHLLGAPYKPAGSLAETRSIDLSIQFLIFWTPLLVLVALIFGKPFSLLFDTFEVILLLAAGFLLNYVTFDSKTNWAEGVMLVAFYFMVVITAWFYPGRHDFQELLSCSVLSNVSNTLLVQSV